MAVDDLEPGMVNCQREPPLRSARLGVQGKHGGRRLGTSTCRNVTRRSNTGAGPPLSISHNLGQTFHEIHCRFCCPEDYGPVQPRPG